MRPTGMRRTWVWLIGAALLVAACGSAATSSPGSSQAGTQTRADRLRLGGCLCGYPNPFTNSRGYSQALATLVYDSLIYKNPDGSYIPWVAKSWTVSQDGLAYRFVLRDDVTFQDGTKLTAEDVAFTFTYMSTGPGKTAPSNLAGVPPTTVTVESPSVVTFATKTPVATFLDAVPLRIKIMPKAVWSTVTDPITYRGTGAIVGSGPYVLSSYDETAGSYLYLSNEKYFLGSPAVKRLEFIPVKDEVLALKTGGIDAVNIGTGGTGDNPVPDDSLSSLSTDRYGTVTSAGQVGRTLHINMTKGFPYSDVTFRQALAYAIDRQDLVKRSLLSTGQVANMGVLEPLDSTWIPKDLPTYAHDLAKAKSMLDSIGLKDVNGDGMRELPDGKPFTPQLLTASSFNTKTAELVQGYLKDAGLDVQLKSVDQPTADKATQAGNYELALIYYGFSSDPDGLRTQLSAKAPSHSFAYVFGWNNPAFETLALQQVSVLDVTQRTQMAGQMQQLIAKDVPLIPLYVVTRKIVYDKNVYSTWYFTKGGGPVYPGPINKLIFISAAMNGIQ